MMWKSMSMTLKQYLWMNKLITTMKKNMIGTAMLCAAALSAGLYSCDEEYVDLKYRGTLDLDQLVLKQARDVWNGSESNSVYECQFDADKQARNKVYKLNVALYQNRTAAKEAVVDLVVNKDSLSKAIARSAEGGVYEKYAGAELLPEEFYTLQNTKLTLNAGAALSDDVNLTLHVPELIDYIQNKVKESRTYVLPLSITHSTAYSINRKVDTWMCFVKVSYVKVEVDPVFLADGEGVPDGHTLEGGYKLLWHDEFNGEGTPNEAMWRFEEGFQRNEEDQWYSRNNASMKENALVITARRERVKNPNYNPNASGGNAWKQKREYAEYTSACVVAKGDYAFKYGRVIVRAKVPVEQGGWPAIWSTGNWYEWPLGGEIDILEFYKNKIHANLCWGGSSRWSGTWNSKNYPLTHFTGKDPKWADKYHIWRMDWNEKYIRIYLDDELLNETNLSTTRNRGDHGAGDGGSINPFSNDMKGFGQCMMLNLAIGGNNGRPIEATFPLEYRVDYIRVYQKAE